MSRHLVGMAGTYHQLGEDGQPFGEERIFCFSGFVIDYLDEWCYVTAGHNFGDVLGKYVDKKLIRVNRCSLLDYFGPEAKVHEATPFYYEDEPKFFVDQKDVGVDAALLPLRPYYRLQLEANRITPFYRRHWLTTDRMEFEGYGILGFPTDLSQPLEREGPRGSQIGRAISATLVWVKRLDPVPEHIDLPQGAWFVGKVQSPFSIAGMSGGPIFGFRRTPEGRWEYRVVGIQSGWFKESQIIYGCYFARFMRGVEDILISKHGK
jgi:hypothetical protein